MSGGKVMQSSVSFTLPISCQICLEKVKEPVTCSNQHVFCSTCMNIWLDRNNKCPTCRVEITSQSPLRKIIGGNLQSNEDATASRSTSRELRRARYELVLKEYEDEILQLENNVEKLHKENRVLSDRLTSCQSSDNSASCSSDSHGNVGESCSACGCVKDLDKMLDLTKKLQQATKTYSKTKAELSEIKKLNDCLLKRNDDLKRENLRVREEVTTRSPMKYGRLTVATLEARLEASEKQVAQLNKALERNDAYTEQLETELKSLKSQADTNNADNHVVDEHQNPILLSILNNQSRDIISQAFQTSMNVATPSSKLKKLTLSTPTQTSVDPATHLPNYDETSKESSCAEIFNFEQTLNDLIEPTQSTVLPSIDMKCSISRKLKFDEAIEATAHSSQSTDHNFLSIEDAYDLGIDLSLECQDISNDSKGTSEATLNVVNLTQLSDDNNSNSSQHLSNASPAMKTTIEAGGSRITMSQLSAEEHDIFSRPNSAPSRTFLLSGSRFSALRPLDPPHEVTKNNEFQPVKCISPSVHMMNTANPESESKRCKSPRLRLVSPDEIINTKWRSGWFEGSGLKIEEESRSKDIGILSRVNILKKNNSFSKTFSAQSSSSMSSPLSENRRKQRFSQKRTGELLFQSPLKSPKL